MKSHLLEMFEYSGSGYKPVLDFGAWRVAYLRYCEAYTPSNLTQMERHLETDEVFVLLNGHGMLYLGEGKLAIMEIYSQVMMPGKIYTVKRGAWHAIITSKDANVLIVENNDTGEANTEFAPLNGVQREMIVRSAHQENPQMW